MGKKYYIAYGSNLNVEQMAYRCPRARAAGVGTIRDWRLAFRGSGTGAYLTIEPKKGSTVPVGIWEITDEDEKALDRYEGYPRYYYKRTMKITLQNYVAGTAKNVSAMIYIMREDRPLGVPSWGYVRTCLDGYLDFYLDEEPLVEAINRAWKEGA